MSKTIMVRGEPIEVFDEEYALIPSSDAAAFLTYELIEKCEDPLCPREPSEKASIYMGVDVGRKRDLTVCWGLEKIGDVYWTSWVDVLERAPFQKQFDHISERLRDRRVKRCCIDATGLGMNLAEDLVTAFGSQETSAQAQRLGVYSCLDKPLEVAESSKSAG